MDDRLKATIASLDDDRAGKAFGGSLSSDDPNKFFSDVLKYSFAVLPLLRPGFLKEVPKQGFAEGGSVDDALHVARQAAQQGGGLWDLLKRSAGEMAEMVEPGSTTRETPSVREVAEGMLPRDPYEVVGEAQKKFKEGDKIGAFEEMLGGIPETGAIRAYHGSPHLFDKFDISKIGTGEGAQAYGHGLYFAESEPIARNYLGNPEARYKRFSGHMDPKEEFAFDIATNTKDPRDMDIMMPLVKKYGSNIDFDEAQRLAREALKNRGHMYETLLHVDPEHLLDWDRPLSEQSQFVQRALTPEGLGLQPGGPGGPFKGRRAWVAEDSLPIGPMTTAEVPPSSVFSDRDTAATIYRQIGREKPAISSERLQKAGIPGIKYLDAGSRGAGAGSRNYVMFSHDPIELVRRYNKGGHVLEDDYPTHYLPEVGRQVMADGGVPGQRFAPIDPSMLVGQSTEPYRGGAAYTDPGGLSVAAPFVTGMRGGYPTFDFTPREKPDVPALPGGKNPFEDLLQFNFLSKLLGRAEGGAVDGASIIKTALDVISKHSK